MGKNALGSCMNKGFNVVLNRIGDDIDDADLEAELSMFEEEWAEEEEVQDASSSVPSYLTPGIQK